ncbi:MAG: YgjP-like metallopeptidase domain-containing protein [Mycoplasma sp.]
MIFEYGTLSTMKLENENIKYILNFKDKNSINFKWNGGILVGTVGFGIEESEIEKLINNNVHKIVKNNQIFKKLENNDEVMVSFDKKYFLLFGEKKEYQVFLASKDSYTEVDGVYKLYLKNLNNYESILKLIKQIYSGYKEQVLNFGRQIALEKDFEIDEWKISNAKKYLGCCKKETIGNKRRTTVEIDLKCIACGWDFIEYIFIHELCHTIQSNHSTDFWKEVEERLPNYKEITKKEKIIRNFYF